LGLLAGNALEGTLRMDWTWTTSLDQLWRSPTFPMWLTFAAAAFFALVLVVTLFRAEKSVANGALTVITLLAVAVAAAATMRGFGPGSEGNVTPRAPMQVNASLPALSCIDDLAGDSVEAACEKALFASPDNVAAAVSYAASQIGGLTSFGDVAAANKVMTPELRALRRAVERDRYGLVAHVLATRDRCTSTSCPAFQSLTDHQQISSNMDEKTYDGLVTRHAASWGATSTPAAAAAAAMVDAPASVPTGKPTNADFPSSSSIPAVSIMTPEPAASTAATATSPAPAPAPHPAAAAKAQAKHHPPAPAKRTPTPRPAAAAPVQLAPAASGAAN
jgi:hypothetical protein